MHDARWRTAGRGAATLTGGAALTILWAGAAHAGDAEAVGNTSDTAGNQTLDVTPGADPTVADLDATVVNGGAAGANTGVNGGTEVDITTGHARSSGNESHSQVDQRATSSGSGGGVTVIDQGAGVTNLGVAVADTGFNDGAVIDTGDATAWGNRSWTSVVQRAVVDDTEGVARFVAQAAEVENLGAALAETGWNTGGDITTGNASAGGNEARTATEQAAAVTGDQVGAAVAEQLARTRNRGAGLANTGVNEATGDDSTNDPE
jgi:hypothetical protein